MNKVSLTSICNTCNQVLFSNIVFKDAIEKCKTSLNYAMSGTSMKVLTKNCNYCK